MLFVNYLFDNRINCLFSIKMEKIYEKREFN